ncbi:MAG TPA: presenilin family intramembrane aspartyl protease [Candidatus Paceibacterota bacterium]|nr:presenilin family intramembrane aspartyl protease [Candidatus Paceibacterota bacterium]
MAQRTSLFITELFLYAATVAVGIWVAFRHLTLKLPTVIQPIEPTPENILIFGVVLIGFTVLIVRTARLGGWSLHVAMALAVLVGAQYVASGFLPPPWHTVFGAVLAVAPLLSRSQYARAWRFVSRFAPPLLLHNLAMVVAIAGVSALLGSSLTPNGAVIMLAALSVYDIIAVYRTRHMVAIAERMMISGAVFGFLVPVRFSHLFDTGEQAGDMDRVMILGSGDIGLPLVLASSVVSTSVPSAALIGAFSLAGLGLTHWLFMSQREAMPMAALPPVAMMSILGYLAAILIGL